MNQPNSPVSSVVEITRKPRSRSRLLWFARAIERMTRAAVVVVPGEVLACSDLEERLARIYAIALRHTRKDGQE